MNTLNTAETPLIAETSYTDKYNRVLLSSFWAHKDNAERGIKQVREYVKTEKEYMKAHKQYNKKQGGLCELVGLDEFQVKPYFDLDPKGDFDYSIIDDICEDIKTIYDDSIYIAGREAREEENHKKIRLLSILVEYTSKQKYHIIIFLSYLNLYLINIQVYLI
jgi:hypothetical protein